jgi:uracil-DNA glycosylase
VTFDEWRDRARSLVAQGVPPESAWWDNSPPLFEFPSSGASGSIRSLPAVPSKFLELAQVIARHRDPDKWALLYRLLWRLTLGGEKHILAVDLDDDVRRARLMERSVRRDMHKMTAFVRFKRIAGSDPEEFVAWHRPDHYVLDTMAGWFADRFGNMRWTIFTPDRSARWDLERLTLGPGVPASEAPGADELEDLWRDYYASIFNPARVKLKAMRAEMPARHWATLPETQIIPALLAKAESRIHDMQRAQKPSAVPWVPQSLDLKTLQDAVQSCHGCDLYRNASQAVFGEGQRHARVLMLGEQPGDEEDQQGKPFVGPAGKLLNKALEQAKVERSEIYVTNAVKHFKFEPRGKRRIHAKPTGTEISACRPWLEAEVNAVHPELIVCLGATAARSVLGREARVTIERAQLLPHPWADAVLLTVHPSSLLRMPDEERRKAEWELFVRDLSMIKDWLKSPKHQART